MNILICDDERDIRRALSVYLQSAGYTTLEAENGEQALELISGGGISLVLLDIMMPGLDGMAVMTRLREFSNLPVILLSAKSEDTDKILGLDLGADDYVTKPFNPVELISRIRSQLRRYTTLGCAPDFGSTRITVGAISLDDSTKEVTLDGEAVTLTPREYEILRHLIKNPGVVFSPRELYRVVWKEEPLGAENAVAVHIRHLREKLEINPAEPRYIKVVWGQGYKLEKKELIEKQKGSANL